MTMEWGTGFKISYNIEHAYIHAMVQGAMDIDLVREMVPAVLRTLKEKNCSRLLNDLREADPTKSAMELMSMVKSIDEGGISHHIKRALVVKDRSIAYEFFETALLNRGHVIRAFTDIDDAKSWLLG